MTAAMQTTTAREPGAGTASDARQPHRPVPPPTRRRDLRRAAAIQAAWLADLR